MTRVSYHKDGRKASKWLVGMVSSHFLEYLIILTEGVLSNCGFLIDDKKANVGKVLCSPAGLKLSSRDHPFFQQGGRAGYAKSCHEIGKLLFLMMDEVLMQSLLSSKDCMLIRKNFSVSSASEMLSFKWPTFPAPLMCSSTMVVCLPLFGHRKSECILHLINKLGRLHLFYL